MKKSYYVEALWDEEAAVWCSKTNIRGLVIEADTAGEFEQLMNVFAPQMLAANENIHNARVLVEFRVKSVREFSVA